MLCHGVIHTYLSMTLFDLPMTYLYAHVIIYHQRQINVTEQFQILIFMPYSLTHTYLSTLYLSIHAIPTYPLNTYLTMPNLLIHTIPIYSCLAYLYMNIPCHIPYPLYT